MKIKFDRWDRIAFWLMFLVGANWWGYGLVSDFVWHGHALGTEVMEGVFYLRNRATLSETDPRTWFMSLFWGFATWMFALAAGGFFAVRCGKTIRSKRIRMVFVAAFFGMLTVHLVIVISQFTKSLLSLI